MKLRKRLGQHLLTDETALERIAAATGARDGVTCLEIGPGTGLLTEKLLELGANVVAVEIDEKMVRSLERRLGGRVRLTIVQGSILDVDPADIMPASDAPAVAAGNLPYYITSPIVFRLLERKSLFSRITLLVQKEVGQRMAAQPGDSGFGALSVFCGLESRCEVLFDVGRDSFRPPPRVDSSVVRLTPVERGGPAIENMAVFELTVRAAFEHRRKTIANSMKISAEKGALAEHMGSAENTAEAVSKALGSAGIPAGARAQDVGIDSFINLANIMTNFF